MHAILAAVDFSDITEDVCHAATELARRLGARIWVVHVAPPDPDFVGWEPGPPSVRVTVANELRREHRKVQQLAAAMRREGITATGLLVQGPTVGTILHEAEARDAELIVMGAHGHGALHMALTGSIAAGVLKRATCPVLVVPAASHATLEMAFA